MASGIIERYSRTVRYEFSTQLIIIAYVLRWGCPERATDVFFAIDEEDMTKSERTSGEVHKIGTSTVDDFCASSIGAKISAVGVPIL